MALSHFLVALDLSAASVAPLARVKTLARRDDPIRLLHVFQAVDQIDGKPGGATVYSQHEIDAPARLAQLGAELRAQGFTRVDTEVVEGQPAAEILAACSRHGTDFLVVGAHARTAISRLVFGSVSEQVVRRSPVPVLVVRDRSPDVVATRVVVAVDQDPPSHAAAVVAALLARRLGVRLVAIHVTEEHSVRAFDSSDLGSSCSAGLRPIRGSATEEGSTIGRSLEALLGAEPDLRTLVGRPEAEIIRFAQATDILVCGTHGRRTVGRLAFGDVATQLLRRTPCPVLVVRPGESDQTQRPAAAVDGVASAVDSDSTTWIARRPRAAESPSSA